MSMLLNKHVQFAGHVVIALLFATVLSAFTLATSPSAYAAPHQSHAVQSGNGARLFIHIATASNSTENWTDINSKVTNNNPYAVVFVTPNWQPYHIYDNHPIGVWYHNGRWSIFNQDFAAIPRHAAFNVYALPNANYDGVFTHVATVYNSTDDYTDIDSAATNNNPDAVLLVTPNWAPYDVYDTHPIGVWYHDGVWSIFNQDHTPMPAYAAFNVVVLTTAITDVFVHIATSYNSVWNWTDLYSSSTINNPYALVFVTPNWAPYSVYNNHNIGVWYHNGHWSIFNQDYTAIPRYAAFNVLAV
jgi:hypothetical protein